MLCLSKESVELSLMAQNFNSASGFKAQGFVWSNTFNRESKPRRNFGHFPMAREECSLMKAVSRRPCREAGVCVSVLIKAIEFLCGATFSKCRMIQDHSTHDSGSQDKEGWNSRKIDG